MLPASSLSRGAAAALLVALPACARHRVPTAEPVPVTAPITPRGAAAPPPAPWAVPVALASSAYRRTGSARPVRADGFTVYPFGHGPAALSCAPLRACLVELARGETLNAEPIAGDTERWAIEAVRAGDGVAAPLVVVKALDCDLSTNLVLATDRRTYQVLLEAPACPPRSTNPRGEATHVAFYFPDDTGAGTPSGGPLRTVRAEATEGGSRPAPGAAAVLNRRYAVRAPKAIAWRPAVVYDDGERTVIELPLSARREELPVLYGLEDDGTRVVVNYTVSDGRYVADRVFRRAALVVRRGKAEHVVRIENRGPTRPGGAS